MIADEDMNRQPAENVAEPARLVVFLLLTALTTAGCLADGPMEVEDPTDDPPVDVPFCRYMRSLMDGSGESIYSVEGCPVLLMESRGEVTQTLEIPPNSTGLLFVFDLSLAEPLMEARIEVRNGSQILLQDELTFIAGDVVGRDSGHDPDLENGTRTTELVFSTCEATEVSIDWGPAPAVSAGIELKSFVSSSKTEVIGTGAATCNDYWGST